MSLGGYRQVPTALPLGKRPSTLCRGNWVGPRTGLDGCGKSRLHRNSNPNPAAHSESLNRLSYPGNS